MLSMGPLNSLYAQSTTYFLAPSIPGNKTGALTPYPAHSLSSFGHSENGIVIFISASWSVPVRTSENSLSSSRPAIAALKSDIPLCIVKTPDCAARFAAVPPGTDTRETLFQSLCFDVFKAHTAILFGGLASCSAEEAAK